MKYDIELKQALNVPKPVLRIEQDLLQHPSSVEEMAELIQRLEQLLDLHQGDAIGGLLSVLRQTN